jgi:hypothetical protein
MFQLLLMEEDLRCPSVHYFRHERDMSRTTKPDSFLTSKNPKSLSGFEPTAVRDKWNSIDRNDSVPLTLQTVCELCL